MLLVFPKWLFPVHYGRFSTLFALRKVFLHWLFKSATSSTTYSHFVLLHWQLNNLTFSGLYKRSKSERHSHLHPCVLASVCVLTQIMIKTLKCGAAPNSPVFSVTFLHFMPFKAKPKFSVFFHVQLWNSDVHGSGDICFNCTFCIFEDNDSRRMSCFSSNATFLSNIHIVVCQSPLTFSWQLKKAWSQIN